MSDQRTDGMRRHPDIFTAEEAAAYLRLPSVESLEAVRENYQLQGFRPAGKQFLYWRDDLDKAALRMFGRANQERTKLKLVGR